MPTRAKRLKAYRPKRKTAAKRGYGHRWRIYSRHRLAEHPLCVRCRQRGQTVEATVTDHIVPHRGDQELFWDPDNHQSLCKPCHDHKTLVEGQ